VLLNTPGLRGAERQGTGLPAAKRTIAGAIAAWRSPRLLEGIKPGWVIAKPKFGVVSGRRQGEPRHQPRAEALVGRLLALASLLILGSSVSAAAPPARGHLRPRAELCNRTPAAQLGRDRRPRPRRRSGPAAAATLDGVGSRLLLNRATGASGPSAITEPESSLGRLQSGTERRRLAGPRDRERPRRHRLRAA
jgi:hypothetical protein